MSAPTDHIAIQWIRRVETQRSDGDIASCAHIQYHVPSSFRNDHESWLRWLDAQRLRMVGWLAWVTYVPEEATNEN
jgi:hypothetical protein